MTLAAGRLRDRVDIETPPAVDDAAGGQTGSWTRVARGIAAEVIALGGSEVAIANIETGISRFRVTMRPRTMNTGWRLRWNGWLLDVRSVLPAPRRDYIELQCEGRQA